MSADPARAEALARLLATPLGAIERDAGGSGPAAVRARELFAGVRRHLVTIDAVLERYVPNGVARVEPRLLEALRIGAFQLLYESRGAGAARGRVDRDARRAVLEEAGVPQRGAAQDRDRAGDRRRRRGPARRATRSSSAACRGAGSRRAVLPDFETRSRRAISPRSSARRHGSSRRYRARSATRSTRSCWRSMLSAAARGARATRCAPTPAPPRRRWSRRERTILRRFGERHRDALRRLDRGCPPFREGLVTVQDLVASEVAPFLGASPASASSTSAPEAAASRRTSRRSRAGRPRSSRRT